MEIAQLRCLVGRKFFIVEVAARANFELRQRCPRHFHSFCEKLESAPRYLILRTTLIADALLRRAAITSPSHLNALTWRYEIADAGVMLRLVELSINL